MAILAHAASCVEVVGHYPYTDSNFRFVLREQISLESTAALAVDFQQLSELCWCDCSALREVKIPAGPRLLIMHHLERYRHVLKPGMPLPQPPPLPPQGQTQGTIQRK